MLSAEPALNHSTCSALNVWLHSKSIVVPSGLTIWHVHVLAGHRREAEHVDPVVLVDLVVGGRVGERERHHALLLEVGLVDAGEAAGDRHETEPEAGFHRGVLAAGALAHVLVADHDPRLAGLVVRLGDVGEGLRSRR